MSTSCSLNIWLGFLVLFTQCILGNTVTRGNQLKRFHALARKSQPLDSEIRSMMLDEVAVAAGEVILGLLAVPV